MIAKLKAQGARATNRLIEKGERTMKRVIASALHGCDGQPNLQLIEETLSDGSHVYNVMIGTFEHGAIDRKDAERVYGVITNLLKI